MAETQTNTTDLDRHAALKFGELLDVSTANELRTFVLHLLETEKLNARVELARLKLAHARTHRAMLDAALAVHSGALAQAPLLKPPSCEAQRIMRERFLDEQFAKSQLVGAQLLLVEASERELYQEFLAVQFPQLAREAA